jgi:hypothetical protein
VIPVLLPGRTESDLPTELKATSHWVRVPTLDEQGIEDLYRRITGQPAYPKPPLGPPRVLLPRAPSTTAAEAEGPESEERADSLPLSCAGPTCNPRGSTNKAPGNLVDTHADSCSRT